MFTRNQIEEIKKKLIMLGTKDTQFPDAHKLNGEEIIAIVQDGENKKIPLSSIINDDFINVSKDTTEILTLSTAVSKIDTNNRKLGQVITFKDSANSWAIRQFTGSSLDNWNDISLWKSISGIDELKSQVETNAEDISILSDEIEKHDASILNLNTDVSKLKDKDIETSSSLSELNTKVDTLKSQADTNTSNISSLNTEVSAMQSKVDENTTSISQINTELDNKSDEIAQINNTLAEHTESINAKITTDRIEGGAVTSEKISSSAFDDTLSVSGKIAPADVVGEKLNGLKDEINANKSIPITIGGYFNSYTIGAIPNFVENSNYRYAQCPCFEGQVFKIKGLGANSARLWYTLNADGKIVRNAAIAETSLQEVTIENGEVVIGYNSGLTTTYTFELTTSVPVIAKDIINDYNEKISKVIVDGKDFVRTKVFKPVQGKYFNANGALSISPTFSYLIIPKSDIITDVLSWYPSARGNSTISSVVYFGADGSVLGNSLTNTYFASIADFPDGTDSIGFSIQNSSMADGKFTVFGVKNNLLLSEFNETTFPFGGKTGIVFGDSIMNGVGTEVGYDAPNVMQDYMHCRIYNGGVGGATYKLLTHIVDGFLNNDWTYVDSEIKRVSSSSALRPLQVLPKRYATIKNLDLSNIDFLVFAYGTNDWTSDMVLDNESNPMDTETILGCIRSCVSRLQSAYPNLEIFIITPSYRVISRDSNGNVLTDSDNVRHQGLLLGELSDKIAECAKTLKLPCWNQYWDNGVNRYNATRWLSDGTHRTKEGYHLLGRQIADFMNVH